MTQNDDLKRLRQDLDTLLNKAAAISQRLEVLENRAKLTGPVHVSHPPADQAMPPPLPAEHSTAPPAKPTEKPVVSKGPPTPTPVSPRPVPTTRAVKAPAILTKMQRIIDDEGIEFFIGRYLLPRIGIVFLTLCVVAAIILAARYSTPLSRVTFGYIVCAGLLGTGRWLENKYQNYARVLYSGGIALSYFVTFAAHYVEQARIIRSTATDLALLAVIVAVWAFVAQIRKSRIVAVLVTALGHLTIFLALWESGNLANFAVAGVVVLSLGSAFFLLRNRWYYVGVLGLAGSYINHTVWMLTSEGADTATNFWTCLLILGVYFLVFALAELFAPEDLRRKQIPTWFRTAFVTINSASFFILATLTVQGFTYSQAHQDIFRLGYAAVLFLVALAYLHLRTRDPLYNAYMTKAVAMATFGLATHFGGYTLTAWLAVESVALLYSARRSGLVVTRLLAFAVAAFTLGQGIYVALQAGPIPYDQADYLRHLVPATLAVLGFLTASQLYQRTDWSKRSPQTLRVSRDAQLLFWQLDIISRSPIEETRAPKPLEGLLFPYAYALAGGAIILFHTYFLAEAGHRFAILGGLVLVLTLLAAVLSSKPFGLVAMLLAATALAGGTIEIGVEHSAPTWLAALGVAALGTAAVRADRLLLGEQEGLSYHQLPAAPYFLYGTTGWLLGLLLSVAIDDYLPSALALMGAAAVAACLVLVLNPRALAAVATGLMIWAALAWGLETEEQGTALWHAVAWGSVLAALAGDRYFAAQETRVKTPVFGYVLVAAAFAVASRYVWIQAPADWRPFWQYLLCSAFLGYGLGFRSIAAGGIAVAAAAVTSAGLIQFAYSQPMALRPLLCGFGAGALFWVACERLIRFAEIRRLRDQIDALAGLCTAATSVLLVIMLHRIPQVAEYFLTISWTVLAFALFGVSLALAQKYYRYAGLAVFVMAIVRAGVYDTSSLEGFYRVAAFGILGLVLLIVGFGYIKAMAHLAPSEKKALPEETKQRTVTDKEL